MGKKITFLAIIFLALGAGLFLYLGNQNKNNFANSALANNDIVVYKTANCGCCLNYINYMARQGLEVETKNVSEDDIARIKDEYEIPHDMWSCHTSLVGRYIVEGHIPLEAIEKLVSENPDIRGIAMPGMPSGSPGMPGLKTRPFEIYSLHNNGSTELFMGL